MGNRSLLRTKKEREQFGKDVRAYRDHMMITQAQMAALLGLQRLAVARFEGAVIAPSRQTMKKFYDLRSKIQSAKRTR